MSSRRASGSIGLSPLHGGRRAKRRGLSQAWRVVTVALLAAGVVALVTFVL